MKTPKILIVEDEVIISQSLKENLESLGYKQVELAYNAHDATELIKKTNYDIVLMDVNLGGEQDGIDVVNSMKEKFELPVIYITGNSDEGTVERAKLSTPYGFLTKPVLSNDLKIHLEIALYKEQIRKHKLKEDDEIGNIYEGDCTGLSLKMNLNGQILFVSPNIKKITGKPSYFYDRKTIYNASFDAKIVELFERIINELKGPSKKFFYGSIPSSYIGTRLVEIEVIEVNLDEFELNFRDLTESAYKSEKGGEEIKVAIACKNKDITYGFKNIPSFGNKIRVTAELLDTESVLEYLSVNPKGLLVLDIGLNGGCIPILDYIKENGLNETRVIILSNKFQVAQIPDMIEYPIYGYFSKMADDATINEALQAVWTGLKYEDPSLNRLLNSFQN